MDEITPLANRVSELESKQTVNVPDVLEAVLLEVVSRVHIVATPEGALKLAVNPETK